MNSYTIPTTLTLLRRKCEFGQEALWRSPFIATVLHMLRLQWVLGVFFTRFMQTSEFYFAPPGPLQHTVILARVELHICYDRVASRPRAERMVRAHCAVGI